jgi:serine/threonine-protein kinase
MDTSKKIGRYEILEELGRGAMGTVYRAKDPAMDRVVALKTIIAVALASDQGNEFRERFYREARAAGGLAHPGIVPMFDVGEHEGVPFLVMEFISGRTLADAVKKGERLSLDRACEIGQRVAEALGYAHQRGVVHRDIKPANILLTSREAYGIERPKIADFGVAKLAEGRTTLTGQLLGTPAFMPPEQFTGGPIDGRADIFSLGVVLYWMATGEQAFPGESITAVSYKVVHTEPVPPRKLNPWLPVKLESVILKCLAKSPDDRYQTAEELAQDLAKIREQGKVGAVRTPAPQSALSGGDPDATLASTSMAAAPTLAAAQPPAPAVAPQTGKKPKPIGLLVMAAVITLAMVAGGWYALRLRARSAVQATVSTVPPAPQKAVATADGPAASEKAAASAEIPSPSEKASSEKSAGVAGPAPKTPAKNLPAPAVPVSTGAASKKPEPKIDAKLNPASSTKASAAAPEPAPLDFDPKALDPKQNAKLKIDTKQVPAGVEFTVELNGKLYFHKTSAGGDAPYDELLVPPGVQEFRVTAKSGAVKKTSNTVSAEFKAKKRVTLKIELRTQGASPDAGVPQGIYPDTQIVVALK